jgi:predicted small lipoprotein YifL
MKSAFHAALAVMLLLAAAGCRQPDGPMPTPSPDAQEDLSDISKDLTYIATGSDPAAPNDLAYDLRKYTEDEDGIRAVDELSRRTAGAVANKKLPEQTAQRLAHTLWLSIAAPDLSDRQVEALQNDTQSMLMSIGVVDTDAEQVAAQVGEVQRAITRRQRRWYEWF